MDQQEFRRTRNAGSDAANEGKTRADCPYAVGTGARMAWMRGFDSASLAEQAIEREATHY